MGFDKSVFIKKITEDLCCTVCQGVLDSPVQCQKSKLWYCQ